MCVPFSGAKVRYSLLPRATSWTHGNVSSGNSAAPLNHDPPKPTVASRYGPKYDPSSP